MRVEGRGVRHWEKRWRELNERRERSSERREKSEKRDARGEGDRVR